MECSCDDLDAASADGDATDVPGLHADTPSAVPMSNASVTRWARDENLWMSFCIGAFFRTHESLTS
ncbi:hypothetical protein [Rhodanobacter sp. C03]|uniref:hypothetical protein n=1 Tax=Rhodanobacter sp. C03 TaxID=1945858 RepID=UPI00098532B6|nr:hypothetical protein [Rhodanobacter sp. C03]